MKRNGKEQQMSWIEQAVYEKASEKAKKYIDERGVDLSTPNKIAIEMNNAVVYECVEMNAWSMDDEVKDKVGGRYGDLLETAISVANSSIVCRRYFTRITKERYGIDVLGDPDYRSGFDEKDAAVWDFGTQLAQNIHGISQDVKDRMKKYFTTEQIVVLTGMAAVISADNIFESVLEIE